MVYPTQAYHDPSFLKEVWGLYGVGVFVILLRMYVRVRTVGFRGWQGDDYMVIAVLACYTVDAVTVMLCYKYGTNVDFLPHVLAAMSNSDQEKVIFGSKMQLLAWYTYTALIWGLKAMMLFFFNRLTLGLRQQYFVKILGIAVFITYVAVFLTITLACYPTHRNWQVDPYPGLICTFKAQNFYVSTVLNVVTDAALLAIPLPLMWTLQVPVKKKIALSLLLSSGIFVVTAALIRIVMTLKANPSALTINRWGVRETIAGIIAVNVAILRPIFSKSFWKDGKTSSAAKSRAGFTHSDSTRRAKGTSSMWGKVEAFEMTNTTSSKISPGADRSHEKDFDRHTNVAEVESTSDIHHHTNRSSEDLVNPNQQRPRQQSQSEQRVSSDEEDPDLESGASRAHGRIEVTVNQFFQSSSRTHTADRPVSPAQPGWEHESPWNVGWPRQGFGNRVVCKAGDEEVRK